MPNIHVGDIGHTPEWCQVLCYIKDYNRLTLYLRNKRYVYECSPYVRDQFMWRYGRNRGKAVAYIKQQGILVEGGKNAVAR